MTSLVAFPENLTDTVQALEPGSDLGERADYWLHRLHDARLHVALGLGASLQPQLHALANEPSIKEFCPNDATDRRFGSTPGDIAPMQTWISKNGGRGFVGIYTEIAPSPTARLLAYGWAGTERHAHFPNADVTTAYRVGEQGSSIARHIRANDKARGAHEPAPFRLGLALGEMVIATATHFGASPRDISLETWASNVGARALYEHLGFTQDQEKAPNIPAKRPTLLKTNERHPGSNKPAYYDPKSDSVVINDERCFYVLSNHPLVKAQWWS